MSNRRRTRLPVVRYDDGRGPARRAAVSCGVVPAADRGPGPPSGRCVRLSSPDRNLALANDLRLLDGRRHATLPTWQGATGPSWGAWGVRVPDGPRFTKIRVRIFRVRGCAGARTLRKVCISVYDMKREEAQCHSKRP